MARRRFANARVVVTGGSSGIGLELARQLGDRGARVLITARRQDRLEEAAESIIEAGGQCEWIAGDLTDPAHRERIEAHCVAWNGLELLINNAGIGAIGRFETSDEATLQRVMDVNFFAPVELTRILLPWLRRGERPALAIVASVLALAAVPLKSEYCASKFAIHGWAESLRSELKSAGVDVIEAHPSTTQSEFFDNVLGDASQQQSMGAMAPADAAARILKAIERGKPESVFPWAGKALVMMRRWTPALYRWAVSRATQRDP